MIAKEIFVENLSKLNLVLQCVLKQLGSRRTVSQAVLSKRERKKSFKEQTQDQRDASGTSREDVITKAITTKVSGLVLV